MPRPLTGTQLITAIIDACGLRPTRVDGNSLVFTDGVIRHTIRIAKDKHDKRLLGWTVFAEDEALRTVMMRFGGVAVEIWRPPSVERGGSSYMRYRYYWPDAVGAIDRVLVEDLSRYGPDAVAFVADLADLGRLLLSDQDVHRGAVWAELSAATLPARLVKAIILARWHGDRDLESLALNSLREKAETDITWIPGQPYLFRQVAADWAKRYASEVDVDLTDLKRLKKRKF